MTKPSITGARVASDTIHDEIVNLALSSPLVSPCLCQSLPLFIVRILLVVIVVYIGLATYNAIVALRLRIDKAWANIDVAQKQRFDQLPNLVEAVRGIMAWEQAVLTEVSAARAARCRPTGSSPRTSRTRSAPTSTIGSTAAAPTTSWSAARATTPPPPVRSRSRSELAAPSKPQGCGRSCSLSLWTKSGTLARAGHWDCEPSASPKELPLLVRSGNFDRPAAQSRFFSFTLTDWVLGSPSVGL